MTANADARTYAPRLQFEEASDALYVYLIRSIASSDQRYVGSTADLKNRLQAHNAGQSIHTAKFRPWRLVAYLAFEDAERARAFERYLKSGSGRAFANGHFW